VSVKTSKLRPGTADLNRLRWRCRRGMRELDVLLVGYLDRHYAAAPEAQRRAFETLLARPDPEILDLLAGRLPAEDGDLHHVIGRILRID
jgi:antitoxin CptB